MSDLRVAKSFLQAHLPASLQKKIHWPSLQLQSEQYLDHSLNQTTTDVLFRVQFGDAQGFISILIEHQSTVDRWMPFRVLHYCLSILQRYLKSHPNMDLPLVVPIVFYSGQAPYHASMDIFTLFGEHESLARELFLKPFQLIDLCRLSDEELRNHTWASVMEIVQKHVRSAGFMAYFKTLAPVLRELLGQEAQDYIMSTLQYIWNTAELDNPQEFVNIIESQVANKIGEETMTLAEVCRRQGYEEARKETLTLVESRQFHTKQQIAKRLIERGLDLGFVSTVTDLTLEELALIK